MTTLPRNSVECEKFYIDLSPFDRVTIVVSDIDIKVHCVPLARIGFLPKYLQKRLMEIVY
jgi:hypothetical protein